PPSHGRVAMADPRLDSIHLEFPRRDEFRRCRQALLDARGWLTVAAEFAENAAIGAAEDWPSLLEVRPDQLLPGTRFLLYEKHRQSSFPPKPGLNTLARFSTHDIVFSDACISRRHCVILVHTWGGCELHDTASRNGTLVNGCRVTRPVHLASGDRISLC